MNIKGKVTDLVTLNGNKRDQLLPKTPTQQKNDTTITKKPQAKPIDKRLKKKIGIRYIPTKLELPLNLKDDFDLLFVRHRSLKGKGKNEFMVEAIAEKLNKEWKSRGGR